MISRTVIVSMMALCLFVSACSDSKSKGGSDGSGIPKELDFKPQTGAGISDEQLTEVKNVLKVVSDANKNDVAQDLTALLVIDQSDEQAIVEQQQKISELNQSQKAQFDNARENCLVLGKTKVTSTSGKTTESHETGGLSGGKCLIQSSMRSTTKVTMASEHDISFSVESRTKFQRTNMDALQKGQTRGAENTVTMQAKMQNSENSGDSASYVRGTMAIRAELEGMSDAKLTGQFQVLNRTVKGIPKNKMVFHGDIAFGGQVLKVSVLGTGDSDSGESQNVEVYVNGRKIDISDLGDFGKSISGKTNL